MEETQTKKKAVIWPKSPGELGIELKLENPWEMGWSVGHMACWSGVERSHRQKNTCVLGNRGSPVSPGGWLTVSSRYRVLGTERKWAEAVEHDHNEYRSEEETHNGSVVPGWGLGSSLFGQFQGAPGNHCAPPGPKAPLLPFTAQGPESLVQTGTGKGQGSQEADRARRLVTGSAFQKGMSRVTISTG